MPVTTVTPFPLGGPIPAFYADLIDPSSAWRGLCGDEDDQMDAGTRLVPERNPLLLARRSPRSITSPVWVLFV